MDHGWRSPATKKLWRTATERHKTTMNFVTDHIRHLGNEFWWIYIVTDYLMWARNLVPPVGPICHAGDTCHVEPIFRRPGHMGPQPCATRGPHLSCWTHLHPSSDVRDPLATWARNLVRPVAPKDTNKVKWGKNNSSQESNLGRGYQHHVS